MILYRRQSSPLNELLLVVAETCQTAATLRAAAGLLFRIWAAEDRA